MAKKWIEIAEFKIVCVRNRDLFKTRLMIHNEIMGESDVETLEDTLSGDSVYSYLFKEVLKEFPLVTGRIYD